MKLTEKQRRFVDYYIETGNASESARRAGYSQKTALRIGQENMQKPAIRAYIDERLKELESKRVASQQEVMEFLTSVMRGEVTEPVPILDGEGTQRVVNLIPSAAARKSAAEQIGKRYGMWTEKKQLDITGAVTFLDDIGEEDE
ncbi:terminase small subunit [Alkalihalophilus lindianensis]|uniref:Terminase small subunit n=1 Tax=Alkalihalophilus lindianensis TaxID=1630542 RepID=A0ABU3XFE0_9BACI|nr:terminase small subunit [Alkalihalophilus lindianensis]MDV2686617.1 terminase small subunit [Alkalihalophilus lindianensis]